MPSTFPNIPPDRSSKKTKSDRTLIAGFGDGYEQATPDGLNTSLEKWDLSFADYPESQIDQITTFLDSMQSIYYFLWTPPGEVTPKKWRQEGEYTVSFPGHTTKSLNVTIKRVYTL